MSNVESFWNRLKEYEKHALSFVYDLESKGFTPEEIKDLFAKMSLLLTFSKDKDILMRAIMREGRLLDYQKIRKKVSMHRRKYQTRSKEILEILYAKAEIKFVLGKSREFLPKHTFDAWTEELSRTTKWRMKKDLEERGIELEKKRS